MITDLTHVACCERRLLVLTALLTGLHATVGTTTALAQAGSNPRPSQRGTVQQRVGDTELRVDYFRPSARGRDLFPGVVRWGRIWTPGADSATTFSTSTAITVNGDALAAGTYSVWMEPGPDRWTVIFNRVHPVFHMNYPRGEDALRLEVRPRTGESMETLAFYFPTVDGRNAELVMHWGTMVVPLAIAVP